MSKPYKIKIYEQLCCKCFQFKQCKNFICFECLQPGDRAKDLCLNIGLVDDSEFLSGKHKRLKGFASSEKYLSGKRKISNSMKGAIKNFNEIQEKEMKEEIKSLKIKNVKLDIKNEELASQIRSIKVEFRKLESKNNELKKKNANLRSSNNSYKNRHGLKG